MPAPVDISDPFRALADPTRRKIVSLLAAGRLPVRRIAERFPQISRPAVSKHLRILREGGLVTEERSGRERYYGLERERVQEALDWLAGVRRQVEAAEPRPQLGSRSRPEPRRSPKTRARPRKARRRPHADRIPARIAPGDPPAGENASITDDDWKSW